MQTSITRTGYTVYGTVPSGTIAGMARRAGRSVNGEAFHGYMLMLPPAEQRYVWSPVWAHDGGVGGGGPVVVSFAGALEEMGCEDCRDDMVVSHVEVLEMWTDLGRELFEGSDRDGRRCEELARVLAFFAGDLGRAVVPGAVMDDAESAGMALTAIAEATTVASSLVAQSFAEQMTSGV